MAYKNFPFPLFLCFAAALVFSFLFAAASLPAQTPYDPEIKQQIDAGIQKTILNDFTGAALIFQDLIDRYPNQPWGYFYLGATCQAEMLDAESYDKVDDFTDLMERCIEISKEQQKENAENPWAYFFEGSAYLYRSFMDSKMKKIWGAYRNAVKGAGRLEKVIELDSTFYDAYLGVGSYKYWKSSKAKLLTWLPFLKDERDLGIAMVHTAIAKGSFVKLVGRDQLAWISLDNGEADEALQLALENYRLYPQSRFFLWTLVEIYYRNQQWDEALELYRRLLEEARQSPENNHYNEVTCLLRMAEIYYLQGDFFNTELFASEILRLKLNDEMRDRVKPKLKEALKLKQQSLTELAKAEKMSE